MRQIFQSRLTLAALGLVLSAPLQGLHAQAPVLVKDIWPGSSGSTYDPQAPLSIGAAAGLAFFGGGVSQHGGDLFSCGLWTSDGTGPLHLVTGDPCISNRGTELNGSLYFTATQNAAGGALWKTDGTLAGTVLVKHLGGDPLARGSARHLTAVNGKLYFSVDDGVHGEELWTSDGTEAGTAMVADATPGPVGTMDFSTEIVGAGSNVFFTNCCTLWRSDGSAAGTVPLANISASNLAPIGATLYFISGQQELWKSDGTAGTVKVADAPAGSQLTAVNGTLYFSACDVAHGCELWKSDGSAAGTALVKDVTPGPTGSVLSSFTPFGSALLFLSFSGPSSFALWRSDGTDAGTVKLADITGQVLSSTVAGGTFLLLTDSQLWVSDGSAAGTNVVQDLPTQASSGVNITVNFQMTVLGNVVTFGLSDAVGGAGVYRSDGTAAGTKPLGPLVPTLNSSRPNRMADVNGTLFFGADDGIHGFELWRSNGTPESTRLVKDINPGPDGSGLTQIFAAGDVAYFTAFTAATGRELWRSDGTEAGTFLVKDVAPGTNSSTGLILGTFGNLVFFTAVTDNFSSASLWRSDGTDAGTFSLGGASASSAVVEWRGAAWFLGSFQGVNALWRTDGSLSGTSALAALPGDVGGNLSLTHDTLVFSACDAAHGCEPWRSDGTAAGTTLLLDVNPGGASGAPSESYFPVGDLAMFWANDGIHGREPWVTDGTEAGTRLLADINPGPLMSVGIGTAAVGGLRFFVANDGTLGSELWKTDGTPEGTALVRDINPGPVSAFEASSFAVGIRDVYFLASDGLTGEELWRSDGTEAGTSRVSDLFPGPGSSAPSPFFGGFSRVQRSGARIFFVADDGTTGFELWSVPIATTMNVVTPCRLLDTRDGGGPALADGEVRRFAAAGACGIPRNAGQIIANVTAVDPTAAGSIEVGAGGPWTELGTVAFAAGHTRANNAMFAVGTDGSAAAKLSSPGGLAHVVVDVTGYLQ